MVDLLRFFCPVGQYSTPIGVTYESGVEAQWQVEHDAATRTFYQVKGSHEALNEAQEHGYTDDAVLFYYDNSRANKIPYALRDDPAKRGSRWVDRNEEPGHVTERRPYVLDLDPATGVMREMSQGPIVTYMKFVKLTKGWRSALGVVVSEVIELHWYLDKACTNLREIYRLGWDETRGPLGLIEFYDPVGKKSATLNGIWPAPPPAERVPVLRRKNTPRDTIRIGTTTPTLTPTPPSSPAIVPTDRGVGKAGVLYTGDYVNLRPAATVASEPAVRIYNGASVVWYPGTKRSADGWQWVYVETGGRAGWMARVFPAWETQFAPLTTNVTPAPSAMLEIPWVSQLGSNAPDANDCGPAAGTSALRAWGKNVTPKEFNALLGSKQSGASIGDMVNVFAAYDVAARPLRATLDNIRRELTLGNYPIVVIQRGQIPALIAHNVFADAHWIGVRGYDANGFVIVDALVTNGNNIRVSADELGAALAGSKWNGVQQSGYLGVVVDMPDPPTEPVEQTPIPEPEIPPNPVPIVTLPLPQLSADPAVRKELATALRWLADVVDAAPGTQLQ